MEILFGNSAQRRCSKLTSAVFNFDCFEGIEVAYPELDDMPETIRRSKTGVSQTGFVEFWKNGIARNPGRTYDGKCIRRVVMLSSGM